MIGAAIAIATVAKLPLITVPLPKRGERPAKMCPYNQTPNLVVMVPCERVQK